MKKVNEVKNNLKQGFTLLELLIVVLIIGILAGIALPQYKMAVGKSRFATLKNITKSIQESAQRYYMLHGTYNLVGKDLDIDLNITKGANNREFVLNDGIKCTVWIDGEQELVACEKIIFNQRVLFYTHRETGRPALCLIYNTDKNNNAHKLCQKETGKKANQAHCSGTSHCYYEY